MSDGRKRLTEPIALKGLRIPSANALIRAASPGAAESRVVDEIKKLILQRSGHGYVCGL